MKNRLFYLAHPITTRHDLREWELEFEGIYPIELINPFYDYMPGVDRTDIKLMDKQEISRFDVRDPYEIVDMDLRMLSYCDGIVAYINGDPSYGTIFEIAEAKRLGLIVYIICTNGMAMHPWLQVYATKVFSGFAEFEKYISAKYDR